MLTSVQSDVNGIPRLGEKVTIELTQLVKVDKGSYNIYITSHDNAGIVKKNLRIYTNKPKAVGKVNSLPLYNNGYIRVEVTPSDINGASGSYIKIPVTELYNQSITFAAAGKNLDMTYGKKQHSFGGFVGGVT